MKLAELKRLLRAARELTGEATLLALELAGLLALIAWLWP